MIRVAVVSAAGAAAWMVLRNRRLAKKPFHAVAGALLGLLVATGGVGGTCEFIGARVLADERATDIRLLLDSAERGDNCAQVEAAVMYSMGYLARTDAHFPEMRFFVVAKDDAQGYYWRQIAATGERNGSEWCLQNRGRLNDHDPAERLSPDQKVAIDAAVARWLTVHGKADPQPAYQPRIEP
jgi:hypothetical protein